MIANDSVKKETWILNIKDNIYLCLDLDIIGALHKSSSF